MTKNKLVLRESCSDIRRLYYLSSLTYRDMVRIGLTDERIGKSVSNNQKRVLYNKIQKYVKLMIKNNNEYEFTYKYNKDKYKKFSHRYICNENIQSIPYKCRGFLMKHTTDIDMSNCHIVIIKYICRKLGIETPELDYYIANKELVRSIEEPKHPNIKMLIISFLNSYTLKKNINSHYLIRLDKEIKMIQETIIATKSYNDIYLETLKNVEDETDEYKQNNIAGRFMSSLGIKYEVNIISDLMEYLESRGIEVNTYMFDGVMVKGDFYNDNELLEDITEYINNKYPGLSAEWTYKNHDNSIDMPNDFEFTDIEHLCYNKYDKIDIDIHTYKPDMIINREKLGYDFFTEILDRKTKYYVVKSTMGTGKTTSFTHLLKNNIYFNYIAILSRVSLCDYMTDTFNRNGLHATHYKDLEYGICPSRGYVFQVESLAKLAYCKTIMQSDYIVFLDEFKSFIYHLYQSSTLDKTRIMIINLLISIIKKAKYVICVDAHINDFCFDFINFINEQCNKNDKILYIENEYIYNSGIDAEELENEEELLDLLNQNEKWLLVSDCKKFTKLIKKKLNDENIRLYTSDEGNIGIDLSHDRVIISPKVIYGIDSNIERPVFVYNNERTITPEEMIQQVNRERQKTKLYFLFTGKTYRTPEYVSFTDCVNKNQQILNDKSLIYNMMINPVDENGYIEALSNFYNSQLYKLIYIKDSYNSNPFKYFLNILQEDGFNLIDRRYSKYIPDDEEKKTNKEIKEELVQERHNNFDDFINNRHLEFMNIDNNIDDDLKDIVVDDGLLKQHFTICSYFFNEDDLEKGITKIKNRNDFFINCIASIQDKINFLYRVNEILESENKITFKYNKILAEIPIEIRKELYEDYKNTFPDQSRKKDFDYNKLNNILKILFGNICESKRKEKTINKKRYKYYSYDILYEYLEKHYNLYKYRNNNDKTLEEYILSMTGK